MPTTTRPSVELQQRFSEPGASATPWSEARRRLRDAQIYWLSTVRPDGAPHVTPLIGVWLDGLAYVCTGPDERKARNLEVNQACTLMTGNNGLDAGLDVVVEAVARPVTDEPLLRAVARSYRDEYGPYWAFSVRDGAFENRAGSRALVFELAPVQAFAFARGPYSQTRYRF